VKRVKKPEPAVTLTLPAHVAEALCHCLRCGHWWMKHGAETPVYCPGCKRRYWDVPAGTLKRGRPAKA
jgi:Zn finger protein HypA/HybF involved in hydrogenase expression